MKQPGDFDWSEKHVNTLTTDWKAGLSCSQIAGNLGCSRNAVIGKVHRLGLSGRVRASPAPRARKPRESGVAVAARIVSRARGSAQPAVQVAVVVEPVEVLAEIIPIGQRCTLLELSSTKCHWPIGDPQDPDFFFCGGNPIRDMPYCAYHARMAYQSAASVRGDRRKDRAKVRSL